MSYKIRAFEKAELKRASPPTKKVEDISINSSIREVDEFLKERYGYGIWYFIYSLWWVAFLYLQYDMREKISLLKSKLRKLKSAKIKLIENIDQFFGETDIWQEIKRGYPNSNIKLTPDKREKFITSSFNLNKFYKIVNEKIEKIKRRIKFLEIFSRIPGKKLRIRPRNLIILIWSNIMIKEKNEEEIDFENISVLLNWFSLNKKWANYFKSTKTVSPKTPELQYNKYIKYAKDDEYGKIASYFFITCFPDIAEPLTYMFPNPFDLVKLEIEGKKTMARDEFEKTIKKPVF